jgi:methylenetetrahydrofolate reductase (NADPH)
MENEREALLRRVADAYLEIFPARGIEEELEQLPPGSYVAITCSPRRGIEATLDLCERLTRRHLRPVPHVSARLLIDGAHLRDVLARLDAMPVDSIFVPGGDVPEPRGTFSSSLEVLRLMAEIGHDFEDIGIAAYPEGHPFLGDQELLDNLREKQEFATYLVTQMCFDAETIIRWLGGIRASGVHLPAWIGLPGAVERARLLTMSIRIGVGESARFLGKHEGLGGRLLGSREYRPDDLLKGLAPVLNDPNYDIPGFHLFSFNQVDHSERWRRTVLEQLQCGSPHPP